MHPSFLALEYVSCHHTPVHLHFGSDLNCDLSQQTVHLGTTPNQPAASSPQGEQKPGACSLCSAAKADVLHAFTDSLIHSENHHAPPVWPCSPPLSSSGQGSPMDPPWPNHTQVPTPSGSTAGSPWAAGNVLLPPCGQEDPSRLSARSSPLLGPEKDLPRLLGSSGLSWARLHTYQWIIRQIFERTRYKVPWDSRARGRPSSLPPWHCPSAQHAFAEGFLFSRDILGLIVSTAPRPQPHSQAPSSLRSRCLVQHTQPRIGSSPS